MVRQVLPSCLAREAFFVTDTSWNTIVGAVRRRAGHEPDAVAYEFVQPGGSVRTLSFREFDREASRFAGALAAHAAPGDRAILMCPPGLDYNVALLGCMYAGVWPVPALPPASVRHIPRLVALMEDAQPTTVVGLGDRVEGHWASLADRLPPALAAARLLSASDRGDPLDPSRHSAGPDDVALVQYTSGSTGSPRGVVLTHAQILSNLDMIRRAFSLTPDDFAVLWLPPYHDMGLIGGILAPLHIGFGVRFLTPSSFIRNPLGWLEQITATRATVGGGPNFAFERCIASLDRPGVPSLDLRAWNIAFTGAEPIRAATLDRFAEAFAPYGFSKDALYPCYGLAEATLIVSGARRGSGPVYRQVSREALQRREIATPRGSADVQRLVSSGRPVPGLQLGIVEPGTNAPVRPGTVGELRVHGPNVARGYLRGGSERFGAAVEGSDRRYLATGDLGFLDEAGELFICGRASDLIVIRGRNIHPQDVETAAEKAVLMRGISVAFGVGDEDGESLVLVREVGALAAGEASGVLASLRAAVLEAVDIQAARVVLTPRGALPLTSSGKVRRREARRLLESGELPIVASTGEEERPAPPGPADEPSDALRRIVARVLGLPIDVVRPDEPPTHAGLDSFGAMQVAQLAEDELGVLVDPAALLGGDTLASVARVGERRRPVGGAVPTPSDPGPFPLSVGQRAIWHHEALGTGCGYNLPVVLELPADVDLRALEQAIGDLVARHGALRTAFDMSGMHQWVRAPAARPAAFAHRAIVPMSDEALHLLLSAEAARPLDKQAGEVFRALLLEEPGGRRILLLVAHHLVADAWSLDLLTRELVDAVHCRASGRASERPAPPTTTRDIVSEEAAFLSSQEASALSDAWALRLADAPPVVDLPRDRPRPALPSFEAGVAEVRIDEGTVDAIRALARQEGSTPFVVVAAALGSALSRLSGASDIVIGTPAARRGPRHRRQTIGLLMNPVPLRLAVDPSASFQEIVRRAHDALAWARAGEELPFSSMVSRVSAAGATAVAPVFQAMLAWYRHEDLAGPGGPWRLRRCPQPGVPLDLVLDVHDDGRALVGTLRYASSLFDSETGAGFARVLSTVLRTATARPAVRHTAIPVVEGEELRRVTREWARGANPGPAGPGFEERFRGWVASRADEVAVQAGAERITWKELDERCRELAVHIAALPVSAVGLLLERSSDLVVGTVAALLAGVPFVPLDPELPEARIRAMVEDGGTSTVVASTRLVGRVPGGLRALDLWAAARGTGAGPVPRDARVDESGLAYVMFTSGSTGRPKGVAVERRALLSALDAFVALAGIRAGDAMLALTAATFDISVLELLLPLVVGARVVVAPVGSAADPDAVLRLVRDAGVTHLQGTPSVLSVLCDAGLHAPHVTILCGGEPAPAGLFARLARAARRVWNVYGPTETTIWSMAAPATADGDPPLGRPLPGESVYLLDEFQDPVPPGAEGEIHIGGVGVSRGYVGRPALTAERFLPDPYAAVPGARMYRTGDLARYRGSHLEFRGRIDGQLKVRGHRIERDEVEHVLGQHPEVARGVAVAIGEGPRRQLVAAVQCLPGRSVSRESLAEHMRRSLPSFAVPTTFLFVDTIPVTARGKLDVGAIVRAAAAGPAARVPVAPRTDTERALAGIWARLLDVVDVNGDDDFFALGGHSLLTAGLVAGVRGALGRRITIADVFTAPTLSGLAERIDRAPPEDPPGAGGDSAPVQLTDAQRRIWTAEQLAPGGTPRVVLGMRVEGGLDAGALEGALNVLVDRHAELRARYPAVAGRPVREILPALAVALRAVPRPVPLGASALDVANELAAEAARVPFDVAEAPLFHASLWRLGPDDHVFVVSLHHMICDATAAGVLLEELTRLYGAAVAGLPAPALPEPVGLADLPSGRLEPASSAELDWWRMRLGDAPRQLFVPEPGAPWFRQSDVLVAALGGDLARPIHQFARKMATTPFVVVCAAWSVALRRLTGRTDLAIGVDVDLRPDPVLARVVAPLVNQVVLRIDAGGETFSAVVDAVRRSVQETLPHAGVSYDKVVAEVRKGAEARDLFDVKIAYQPLTESVLDFGGARRTRLPRPAPNLREALVVVVLEGDDALSVELHHRVDRCDGRQARQLLQSLQEVLENGVRDPDRPLSPAGPNGRFARRKVRSLDQGPGLTVERGSEGLLTLRPTLPGADLAAWLHGHRDEFSERLAREGSLLFRGFHCDTPDALARAVAATGDDEYDTTEHPRERLGGAVFTPVAYPSRELLLWHNEDSFRSSWPGRLWFACARPADAGGETVVADGGRLLDVVRSSAPQLVERGLLYVRRHGKGLGLDWRVVFATDDRALVEERCRAQGIAWTWDGDLLTTRAVRPGVKHHPLTGEPFWVGQLLHFHPAALPSATRASLVALHGPDEMPRDCRHADGSPIDDAVVARVIEAYRDAERACRWHAGDLLVVDNVRAAHGRRPYEGERRLLVSLSAPLRHDA